MTYFDQIDTINDTFDKSSVNKPDRNNFWDSFNKELFSCNHKIYTYDLILAPKMTQLGPFSQKMTYFDLKWPILTKLTPLMRFLTKIMYTNLTEIIFRKVFDRNSVEIWK